MNRAAHHFAALVIGMAIALGAFAADDATTKPAPAPVTAPGPAATTSPAAAPAAPQPAAARLPPATLVVFNRPIVPFRHAFLGMPPAERALIARERIYAILERGGPGKVDIEPISQGSLVKIDGAYAFVIPHDDVATGAGETMDDVAHAAAAALTRAIAETHESRDTRLMLRAAVLSVVATVIYALLLYVLLRVGRRLTRRMLHLTQVTSNRLRIGGGTFVHRHRLIRIVHQAIRIAGFLLIALVTYEWLGFVLGRFPYTRAWSEQLNGFLIGTALDMLVAVAVAIPDLLVAIAIFVLAHTANRLLRGFFDGVQTGRIRVGWVDKDTAPPSRRLATIAVWIFALVMAYPYIPGSSTDAFKGLSVLLGLMISVGASGIIGQAGSGLILMYTRTYRPGEYVRIGDSEGTIVAMGMFTTRIRTGMGEELTIPSATALTSVTRNYSRPAQGAGLMLEARVSIGYDTPWRQVQAMLIEAARRTRGVLADPAPKVFQTALADFYVEYRVVCLATHGEAQARAEALSELRAAILDTFNEHGVQIMSPHYFGDPADAKVVPREHWYAAPAEPPPPPA